MTRTDAVSYTHLFCCNTLDHPEQALPYLEKSVAINDQDIWSQCELARCYAMQGKPEEALPHFLKAKELGRDDAWIEVPVSYTHLDPGVQRHRLAVDRNRVVFDDTKVNRNF